MSYSLRIDENLPAVVITRAGEVDLAEMNASHAEVLRMLEQTGYTKLLSDASAMTSGFGTTQNFQWMSRTALTFPPGIKIAAVVPAALWEQASFAAQVSANRGLPMQLFGDLASARAWLAAAD